MQTHSWLLLLFSLPAGKKTERVSVWRRLKKSGAIQLTTSTYVLPDRPPLYELFQWLAKQIRDYGGEATLIRAQEIEGRLKREADPVVQLGARSGIQRARRTGFAS